MTLAKLNPRTPSELPMWRVECNSRWLYWGPWCFTRRHAILSWLFVSLRLPQNGRLNAVWNWCIGSTPKRKG
jgi:hypothetical protein